MSIAAVVGIVALGVALGMAVIVVIKVTVKALVKLVKRIRDKNASKVIVADVQELIDGCTNRKSFKEMEKLADDGITHIVAGVDKDNNLVDTIQLIKNEDDEVPYEVMSLLGDEGMVVIED